MRKDQLLLVTVKTEKTEVKDCGALRWLCYGWHFEAKNGRSKTMSTPNGTQQDPTVVQVLVCGDLNGEINLLQKTLLDLKDFTIFTLPFVLVNLWQESLSNCGTNLFGICSQVFDPSLCWNSEKAQQMMRGFSGFHCQVPTRCLLHFGSSWVVVHGTCLGLRPCVLLGFRVLLREGYANMTLRSTESQSIQKE